jgi:hypothetical protein
MGFVADFVTDVFNNAAKAFSDFVAELERTVRNVVDEVVRTVEHVVAFIADYWPYILIAVVSVVVWYASPYLMYAEIAVSEAGVTGAAAASIYVESFYLYYASFLSAISWSTVLAVHNIAYLMSADYRNMINGLYQQIGQVSQAIGLGAESLYLFFQNARTLVIDASTSLGQRYDLASVSWLSSFSGYLKTIKGDMSIYAKNPGQLIQDLAQYLEKPAQDAKAEGMQVVYGSIQAISGFVNDTLQTTKKLEQDILRLTADLPESIRRYVKPITDKLDKDLNDFVKLVYLPAKSVIDGALKSFGQEQDAQKERIHGITQRIARPGQYLLEVDALPDAERIADESAISQLAFRPAISELSGFEEIVFTNTQDSKLEKETSLEERPVIHLSPGKVSVPTVWEEVKVETLDSPFIREDL